MEALTSRQQRVLDAIKEYIKNTGYPPTRAELANILGFKSPNAAEEHIKALSRKGHISIVHSTSRGIRLTEPDLGLPVVGRVAAGSPILAEEQIQEHVNLPTELFNPPADFMLRVQGLSMKNIGILEDDLIAVHKSHEARNGDIIVARVGNEVTVKRYEKQGNSVTLHSENEEFSPIHINLEEDDFEIEGLYVGVIRRTH